MPLKLLKASALSASYSQHGPLQYDSTLLVF